MALLDDIRNHMAVMNPAQRERRTALLLREAAAEIERLRAIALNESDSPQPIDACELHAQESQPDRECIVRRLRQTRADMIGTDDEQHYWDCQDAAAEIERLRGQPCPYVTGTVTRYCTLTPLALTDAEREAIERAIDKFDGIEESVVRDASARCSLRGLLERTRSGALEGREAGQ
jgi:hypothetical protein